VLHVLATDPGSVKDFEAFARQTGNELLSSARQSGLRVLPQAQVGRRLAALTVRAARAIAHTLSMAD
jgi:hypothetical protein